MRWLALTLLAGCATLAPRRGDVPPITCFNTDMAGVYCCAPQALSALPAEGLMTGPTCGCFFAPGPPLGAR